MLQLSMAIFSLYGLSSCMTAVPFPQVPRKVELQSANDVDKQAVVRLFLPNSVRCFSSTFNRWRDRSAYSLLCVHVSA